jgi:hypothetical protein
MTKFQVPTIGGIRKVIKQDAATSPGTTIAEVGSGTISLSQLAQYITQIQTAQQNNTQGAGDDIYIVVGPGLAGGGSVGVVPIRLTAPIPYFGGEDGADGADGPPGAAGPKGATGNAGATGSAGATGPAGVGVMGPPGDDGADGEDGRPGPQGNQGPQGLQGSTGPAGVGVQGQAGDDGADGDIGPPGAAGPRGATGQNGAQGVAGPALYLAEDTSNDDGFCFPFGSTATVSTGTGTVEPFNITPDSHPVTPTGVGLGPNDEFEYSTSLDTAGARYASADAWITVNWSALGGTTTAPVAQGNLQFISEANTSSARDPQLALIPLAGGWVSYVAKFNVNFQGGSGNLGGIVLYESGTGKTLEWSVYNGNNSSFFKRTIPASITQVGSTTSNPMPVDSFTGTYPYRYIRVLQSGANVVFQVSLDGITYTTLTSGGTLAIATYFTTAPTHIGFVVEAVSSSIQTVLNADFIRQTA